MKKGLVILMVNFGMAYNHYIASPVKDNGNCVLTLLIAMVQKLTYTTDSLQ